MAIAYDTRTVGADYSATGSQTTSHAGSASARAACVLIEQNGSATDEVTTVTYGGVAMTEIRTDSETTEAGRVYIFWLDGIATGTQNVVMTTTGSSTKTLVVATMTVAANKAVAVGGHASATSASASNPQVTITGLTNATSYLFMGVIHSGLQTMTTTPGTPFNATAMAAVDRGSQGYGMARGVATTSGTSQACNWTAATADDYVFSAVAFLESAINYNGDVTQSETVTLSASGNKAAFGDASRSETITLTSTGAAGKSGDVSTSLTAGLSSAGAVARTADTSGVNELVSLSASGSVAAIGNVTLTETVTLTASGAVSAGAKTGDATLVETVSTTVSGVASVTGDASLAVSATRTTAGAVAAAGDAARAIAIATGSAGTAAVTGLASLAVSTTPSSDGVVAFTGSTVTASESVSISASGSTTRFGDAALSPSVAITTTGKVEGLLAVPTEVSISVSASGSTGVYGDASLHENITSSWGGYKTVRIAHFSPPTYDVGYGRKVAPAHWWVKKENGITLLKEGAAWRQTVAPSNDEIVAADRAYLGGRDYELDATQESELIAAGYGGLIHEEFVNV